MTPYKNLAAAIVELAVKDYKTALKYHYKHPDSKEYSEEVNSLEQFFRSGWYGMLTELNGEYLMERVQSMVRKEMAV